MLVRVLACDHHCSLSCFIAADAAVVAAAAAAAAAVVAVVAAVLDVADDVIKVADLSKCNKFEVIK